ncbi:hypothetical protein Atai01_72320 [Amycolatopsis taiwanensis]|uniref:Uncharacterized protein n=1 Tax=Amycolatopsis taiwanensis TaxID=342230 RepID=A0A9W6VGC0_9PSEU|nr:hypothetical protein Atai01_72320 [Amycolatopsis taiwanensis]
MNVLLIRDLGKLDPTASTKWVLIRCGYQESVFWAAIIRTANREVHAFGQRGDLGCCPKVSLEVA